MGRQLGAPSWGGVFAMCFVILTEMSRVAQKGYFMNHGDGACEPSPRLTTRLTSTSKTLNLMFDGNSFLPKKVRLVGVDTGLLSNYTSDSWSPCPQRVRLAWPAPRGLERGRPRPAAFSLCWPQSWLSATAACSRHSCSCRPCVPAAQAPRLLPAGSGLPCPLRLFPAPGLTTEAGRLVLWATLRLC